MPLLAILPTFMIGVLAYETDAGPWWAVGMCVYVLCAGAAVTSLGLALATRFPRVGQAVGATVSLYVVFTVGWFFLMLVMSGGCGRKAGDVEPVHVGRGDGLRSLETRTVPHIIGLGDHGDGRAAWFALEVLVSTLAQL